jgi:hypothetical protein
MSGITLGPPLPFVTEGAFSFPRVDIPKTPVEAQTPRVAPEKDSWKQNKLPGFKNPIQNFWTGGKLPQPEPGLPLGRGADGLGTLRIGKTSAAAPSQFSATGVANESIKINVPGGSISVNKTGAGASVNLSEGLTIEAGNNALGLGQTFKVGKGETLRLAILGTINGQKNTPTFTLETQTLNGGGLTITIKDSEGKIQFNKTF